MVVLICFGLKERKEQALSTSYAVRSIGLPPSRISGTNIQGEL
jgi:hypothetical protein